MTTWRPLLEDRDAERAWEAIHDIAEWLREDMENFEPTTLPSTARGTAGMALFYAYLGAATDNEQWTGIAHHLIEHSIDALSNRPLPPDLYEGFTGIGWAVGHLEGMLFEPGEDDDDPIGASVLHILGRPELFARGDFALQGGLCGYGIYALDALPRPNARRCLELLVERLIEIGEPADGGFSWFSPADGKFNLGVQNGVAGVISVLGMCAGTGVMSDEQRAIYDQSVAWLLVQKPHSGREAWCDGNAGIAAALFTAARHCGHAGWEAAALDVARTAARRPVEDSGVVDARLCHGSAGLAHLFNRMYQASDDPLLAEAARRWFRHALDIRHALPRPGIAGYPFFNPPQNKWRNFAGFVEGACGVGLGLLGGVSSLEPRWDRFFAVSVPLEPRLPEPGARP